MVFFFEGNIYADESYIINSSIGNSIIVNSSISSSSIDMLNTSGNYQNITNTAIPINSHDVAIKLYVDNLGININDFTLSSLEPTTISNSNIGSFIITITNLVLNGPSAIFHITKNNTSLCGHVVRTSLSPGTNTNTTLDIRWPANSGPQLFKSNISYDGSYRVKIM
jgi:hypothetical protein